MKTDVNGCSTCPVGQEQWEKTKLPSNRKINAVQYDFRDTDGELFSTVAINLEVARKRKASWLIAKLLKEYNADPNCRPFDWIAGERLTEEEKEEFISQARSLSGGSNESKLKSHYLQHRRIF
jgi:hypothetical protein